MGSKTQFKFSVRSLLFATFLVAWVLAVNNGLAQPWGWMTAIPLAYSAPLVLLNLRTILGGVIGAFALGAIGEIGNGWEHSKIEHWRAVIVFVAYGFACGVAIQSIIQKKYILGTTVFLASVLTLVYNLMYTYIPNAG